MMLPLRRCSIINFATCLVNRKVPAENDRELPLPFVERHIEHAFLIEDGGAVDQDVDAAERFARRGNGGDHLALIGDIAGHGSGASTGAL